MSLTVVFNRIALESTYGLRGHLIACDKGGWPCAAEVIGEELGRKVIQPCATGMIGQQNPASEQHN